jgi:hypothetical protein
MPTGRETDHRTELGRPRAATKAEMHTASTDPTACQCTSALRTCTAMTRSIPAIPSARRTPRTSVSGLTGRRHVAGSATAVAVHPSFRPGTRPHARRMTGTSKTPTSRTPAAAGGQHEGDMRSWQAVGKVDDFALTVPRLTVGKPRQPRRGHRPPRGLSGALVRYPTVICPTVAHAIVRRRNCR